MGYLLSRGETVRIAGSRPPQGIGVSPVIHHGAQCVFEGGSGTGWEPWDASHRCPVARQEARGANRKGGGIGAGKRTRTFASSLGS
jgi:hypothetical protein